MISNFNSFVTPTSTTTAKLYFHQGWTDIINCLPLINYYSKNYGKLDIIAREDSKDLVDFYLRQFNNVNALYMDKKNLDSNFNLPVNENDSLLFFGVHDRFRKDGKQNSFSNHSGVFVEGFYTPYGIPYMERVNSFGILRDESLENETYERIIGDYTGEYIVVHEDSERGLSIVPDEKDVKIIKLNGASDIFFDYIKILENAKSIHLIDSVWAAICYLIDSRYGILKDVGVSVHCLRGYEKMFLEPKKLSNWKIN